VIIITSAFIFGAIPLLPLGLATRGPGKVRISFHFISLSLYTCLSCILVCLIGKSDYHFAFCRSPGPGFQRALHETQPAIALPPQHLSTSISPLSSDITFFDTTYQRHMNFSNGLSLSHARHKVPVNLPGSSDCQLRLIFFSAINVPNVKSGISMLSLVPTHSMAISRLILHPWFIVEISSPSVPIMGTSDLKMQCHSVELGPRCERASTSFY
jgi:hypothetical protein